MFQESFTLPDEQWEWITDQGWFLFIGLRDQTRRQIISHAKERWELKRLTPQIREDAAAVAAILPESCSLSPLFAGHRAAIEIGTKHFLNNDSFSAACVLYPVVEGILRSHYRAQAKTASPRFKQLIDAARATALTGRHAYCLLLVHRFDSFLRRVIFADFDWQNPSGVSRHSLLHGVVDPADCDDMSVARVLFSIHQLTFSLNPPPIARER